MDALFELMRDMRLSGGVFLEAEFTAPWSIFAQVGPEDCAPFTPPPSSIIAYHYVSEGQMLFQVDDDQPVQMAAGEILLLPRNDLHRLCSSLDCPPVSADEILQPGVDGSLARIVHGGGGERAVILCGFLGSNAASNPILELLPKALKINLATTPSGAWIESSLRYAGTLMTGGQAGAPSALAKLAELLFMEAVHRYASAQPPGQVSWLNALQDPIIARALLLLHGHVDRNWTTDMLAREAGASRSAFASRFAAALGQPPMRYLESRRMQIASEQLSTTQASLLQVATSVGYGSEAAFSRAFRRHFGLPPATWRRQRQMTNLTR